MGRSTIELEIADDILTAAQGRAQRENCRLESVLEDGLALLFGSLSEGDLPVDRLYHLSDEQLWTVVHLRLTFAQDRQARALMERGRNGELTPAEKHEFEDLLELIDRQTVLRSHALALLHERGHDTLQYLGVQTVAE